MQLTERHLIKPDHKLYNLFDDLTFKAKNLYNTGLYLYRQSYFEHRKNPEQPILWWMDIDRTLRQQNHTDVRALPAKVAGTVLKNLGEAITSYWGTVRLNKSSGLTQRPKLPQYLHKTKGRYPVTFNNQTFGRVRGPHEELILCPKGLCIPIQTRVENPKQVRIIPNHGNFIIEVVYDVEEPGLNQTSNYVGIDLGVDNFATIAFSSGQKPLIVKGLELKSINQGYNRLISKAKSLLPDSQKTSKYIHRLWSRRSRIMQSKIHQMTAFLTALFDEMNIETVFIGLNKNWKQDSPFGKIANQRFAHLPYGMFIGQLRYKCRLRGIAVVTQEESYTSKASFLDNDDIPVYGVVENPTFSGRRIKRGLYRASDGRLINADVNGAYNILRKGLGAFGKILHVENLLIQPTVAKGMGQKSNEELVGSYVTPNI